MQYVRGAITTQNLVPTGIATAGSAIQLPLLTDDGEVAIQVTSTYTGALTPQGSVDQVTWVDLAGVTNASTGVSSAAIASGAVGIFRADVSGLAHFRLSANGPVTGSANVHIRSMAGAASGGGASGPSSSTVVIGGGGTTSTVTNVAASASSVTLLAANTARKNAVITNDTTSATLRVILKAAVASSTSYTVILSAGESLVLEPGDYTGEIRGIWDTATGFAMVTEVV